MATLRLLEIVRDQKQPVKFYHASTSEIFGCSRESPQHEETPMLPASPYGCAKAFATQLVKVYRQSYGIFACNGILYNHESPRRGENFVTRKIARAVARIAKGLEQELVLGDLTSKRDWGHAREYVEAMWKMLRRDKADDYVIATGETHSVGEFVEAAFAVVGLPWKKYVRQSEAFTRPSEPILLVGSPKKAEQELGWKATTKFPELVLEMVEAELASLEVENGKAKVEL